MKVREAMTILGGFTADQWGLVTSAQATGAGVNRTTLARMVEAGLFDHVRRGVYAVLAAPEDPLRETRAAWLQLNPAVPGWERSLVDPDGGVVSHTTAARVHDLGDMLGGRFHFIVARRRTTKYRDIALHLVPLDEQDVTKVDGLPVTTADRTIADLLHDRFDAGHVGDAIYQALLRRMVDPTALAKRVAPYARRYGIAQPDGNALLRHLVGQAGRVVPTPATTSPPDELAELFLAAGVSGGLRDRLAGEITKALLDQPELRRTHDTVATALMGTPELQELKRRLEYLLGTGEATPQVRDALLGTAELPSSQPAAHGEHSSGGSSHPASRSDLRPRHHAQHHDDHGEARNR